MADYPHTPLGPQTAPYSYQQDPYPPAPSRYAGGRTPSPTPSEIDALSANLFNVRKYMNWKFWARKDWIPWYIIGTIILVATILISVKDKEIVHWLTPAGKWMRDLKFGWLIPIAILFVISFPPLFGHEIVAILVGVIWGLGIGFAIVSAGTFIGEIGNYYAFKYCCRARGEKMEKSTISYACLARVVREGGFKVALVIRLSVIPGHFSTAVFSTCGMNVLVFALAAFLSLPKQLVTVYIGVILEESGTGASTTKDTIISDVVLAITILITLGAGYYIWREINRVKPGVVYDRRKARQVKMADPSYTASTPTLYQRDSETDLPLSVIPQRPAQFGFTHPTQPQRTGSGNYAGQGGYTPSSYPQGRYGDPLAPDEERKSTEVVGWETRGTMVEDMRGAKWSAPKAVHESDDEDDSEEGTVAASASDPALPPALPPPGAPRPYGQSAALPNPYDGAGAGAAQRTQRHVYELSDPPVAHHTPVPSDSTYAPSHADDHAYGGYAQTDVPPPQPSLYSHSAQPTDASYDSQYPLTPRAHGHAAQATDATDASYYTAAGPPSREPSDESPFAIPPRTLPGRS